MFYQSVTSIISPRSLRDVTNVRLLYLRPAYLDPLVIEITVLFWYIYKQSVIYNSCITVLLLSWHTQIILCLGLELG